LVSVCAKCAARGVNSLDCCGDCMGIVTGNVGQGVGSRCERGGGWGVGRVRGLWCVGVFLATVDGGLLAAVWGSGGGEVFSVGYLKMTFSSGCTWGRRRGCCGIYRGGFAVLVVRGASAWLLGSEYRSNGGIGGQVS